MTGDLFLWPFDFDLDLVAMETPFLPQRMTGAGMGLVKTACRKVFKGGDRESCLKHRTRGSLGGATEHLLWTKTHHTCVVSLTWGPL